MDDMQTLDTAMLASFAHVTGLIMGTACPADCLYPMNSKLT